MRCSCAEFAKLGRVLRGQVLLYADSSVDVNSWVSQSELQITFMSEVASFSALQAVAPGSGGHLCVELRQEACPDGSGPGVIDGRVQRLRLSSPSWHRG